MKIKNQRLYSDDPAELKRWAEEIEYIGREFRLNLKEGVLIVYALPQRHKKKRGKKTKEARNKRAESAARRS